MNKKNEVDGVRILRIQEVCRKIGLSKASVYRLISQDLFPPGLRLSEKAVGWRDVDVELFIRTRPESRSLSK